MEDEHSVKIVESAVGMMDYWSPSFGDRVFYFDAFFSHNANDPFAQKVAKLLHQLGVRVWWDANGDMRSRRVVERIKRALYFSRYVVVCIGATYRDSSWTRAEYMNALKAEAQAPGSRVVVAFSGDSTAVAAVPEALRHVLTYVISNDVDAACLASYVSDGNRLPSETTSKHGQQQEATTDYAWLIRSRDTIVYDESQPIAIRLLAAAFFENASPQILMGARCAVRDVEFVATAQALSETQRQFLYESGCWFARSTNADDRANGLMILGRLDQLELAPSARSFLFEALARETKGPTLRCLWEWLMTLSTPELTEQLPALAHSALLDGSLFEGDGPLARIRRELPEALRVRIVVNRTLDLEVLAWSERAKLAVDQIDYHLESNSLDEESRWLSVDVEMVLRDLLDMLIESGRPREVPDGARVEELFVMAAERIASLWEGARAKEMAGLAEWIPDFVAIPLLWVARDPRLRTRAIGAYLRICSALKRIPCRTELGTALANAANSEPARSFREAEDAVGNAIAGARWSV